MIILFHQYKKFCTLLRGVFWRMCFNTCGSDVKITGKIKVYSPQNINIGHSVSINESVILNARGGLVIEDYCRISPGVIINTGGLNISENYKVRTHFSKSVICQKGVWICSGAIINPGVTLGEGAVILSGAVVVDDVVPFTMVGGIPARVIKSV